MDQATARELLTKVLSLLPRQQWRVLREVNNDDQGIGKAFKCRRVTIDALLIKTGLFKENGNGFSKNGKAIKEYEEQLSSSGSVIEFGTKGRDYYVTNERHPEYRAPKDQLQSQQRYQSCVELPLDTKRLLVQLEQDYLKSKKESRQDARSKAAKEKQAEEERKAEKAKQLARSVEYPILSKIIPDGESICLDNQTVKEWHDDAMAEVVHLHQNNGTDIYIKNVAGREQCLLPVPRSSDCESFMECDRQTRWIERCIQMSVGGDMSIASAIECFRRKLDAYEKAIVTDEESPIESDSDESDSSSEVNNKSLETYFNFVDSSHINFN